MIGCIHSTKGTLDSIKKLTQLSQDRFSDKEFGKFLYRMITEDVHKADLLLSGLLNYFQVTTPVKKTNTVNTFIEEALKRNQAQLEEKGVKLFKKLEKDLPEIIVPDEQLKYILNSVLRYLISTILPNGKMELLTRSFIFQRGTGGVQASFEEYGGYIEISIVFAGNGEPAEQGEAIRGRISSLRNDEAVELMLRLAKEMVLKNRGAMKFKIDEKRAKKVISLVFPIERREVVFYEPISMNQPANHLKILDIWE